MYFLRTGALLDNVLWDRPQPTWNMKQTSVLTIPVTLTMPRKSSSVNSDSNWEFPCINGPSHHIKDFPTAKNCSWEVPFSSGNSQIKAYLGHPLHTMGTTTPTIYGRHVWSEWSFPVATGKDQGTTINGSCGHSHLHLGMPTLPSHAYLYGRCGRSQLQLEMPT